MTDGLVAGRKVGPYRLLFRLGKGGMGEVWAASRDDSRLGFQKLIALKVLLNKEKDSNAAVMFFDEAKTASVLQHHAIVPTVDLGGDGDVFYLAMEMVRGPSLTALLQRLVINRRTLTPAQVAHIGISIASALDYAQTRAAHEGRPLKLIHRDVSPHNVLLDLNGAVRLTDFGVARTAIQDHKSRVGTVRGKPSYMAPEQVVGGDIDGRTDIFSLGIVLYECACLKRLFGRSNPVKSMDAVLKHEPTPLLELVENFPQPLWAVIEKALQKEPGKRLQSAREMVDGLTEAMRSLEDATTAQMDLTKLIEKNFEPDAFDIESKVQIALAEAGIEIDGPQRDPTVAGRARDIPDTQIVWPTAYAPDPLAPEAIEEARTQFRALTPSASVAMQMQTPAVDFTPMSQSFMGQVPRQRSWLPLVALVIAALVVTMVAIVVVQKNGPPAVEIAEAVQPQAPPPPAPMIEARKEAPAVRSAPKIPPPPPASPPPPVEPPAAKKPVKPVKNDPPPADRTPEQAPTFKEVHTMIKQLRAIDEEQGKKMYVTLLEVGSNDPKRLAELRTKVKAALETKK